MYPFRRDAVLRAAYLGHIGAYLPELGCWDSSPSLVGLARDSGKKRGNRAEGGEARCEVPCTCVLGR